VHTNNGLERLHLSLKEQYLGGRTQLSLTTMAKAIMQQFLPDKKEGIQIPAFDLIMENHSNVSYHIK